MARTKNEKKKKKEPKTCGKPHYVLEVQDSTLSSKDIIGKGGK
jgi:hypothetical protein